MWLSVVAELEAQGLDASYHRDMLMLAWAEARYRLGRVPGGEGHELLGVGRCWRITAGGKPHRRIEGEPVPRIKLE
jgi:hypothetical protein